MASIRIPRSGGRDSKGFTKLLSRVNARRADAFGFEGRFLRPGDLIEESDLMPPGWPNPPLVLEYVPAEGARHGWARHEKEDTWLLWTWTPKTEWREIGRAAAAGAEWVQVLRPLALAHLAPPPLQWRRTIAEARERIIAAIDAELEAVEAGHRPALLSVVHDVIASRAAFLPSFAADQASPGGSVGSEESRPTDKSTVVDFSLLSLPYMQAGKPQSTVANSPSALGESGPDSPSTLGELAANWEAHRKNPLAKCSEPEVDYPTVASTKLTAAERAVWLKITSRGGKNSAAKLTPEQRSERARKAAAARYAKRSTGEPEAASA